MKNIMAVIALLASNAYASTHTYKVHQVPKHMGDCWDVADTIQKKFEIATGIEDTMSICESEDKEGYEIQVSYEADERLDRVSTRFNRGFFDGNPEFKKLSDCQAHLHSETLLFEKNTGLKAVASHCSVYISSIDGKSYRPVVESLGDAKITPRATGIQIDGTIQGHSRGSFTKEVDRLYKAIDLDVSAVFTKRMFPSFRVVVNYYAEENVRLESLYSKGVPSLEACKAEQDAIKKRFSVMSKSSQWLTFCTQIHVGSKYENNIAWTTPLNLSLVPSGEEYRSYDSCARDRDSVVRKFERRLGDKLLAGYCESTSATDRKKFTVRLIVNK